MNSAKKILIFRIGQLGDMLVSVPALWAIRDNYPEAHLTLLCDGHIDRDYVTASDVLEGSGIADDFFPYYIVDSRLKRLTRFVRMLGIIYNAFEYVFGSKLSSSQAAILLFFCVMVIGMTVEPAVTQLSWMLKIIILLLACRFFESGFVFRKKIQTHN